MMFDFQNATFLEGQLITNKKGVQVLRQKHQGTKFVSSLSDDAAVQLQTKTSHEAKTVTLNFQAPLQKARKSRKTRHDKNQPRKNLKKKSTNKEEVEAAATREEALEPDTGVSHGSTEDEFRVGVSRQSPISMPESAMYGLPVSFSTSKRRALRAYMDLLPRHVYTFEVLRGTITHNPLRTPLTYWSIVQDPSVLNFALVIGEVCEAVKYKITDSMMLSYHSTKLCALVNESLPIGVTGPCQADALVQGVATLALICHLIGEYEHWHIHMAGLKRLVEVHGGLGSLFPATRWLIHKADIVGAMELATNTYFPVHWPGPSVVDLLDKKTKNDVFCVTQRSIGACCNAAVVRNFTDSALMIKATFPSGAALRDLDPDLLMEQWYFIASQFVNTPKPILAPDFTANKSQAEILSLCPPSPEDLASRITFRECLESTIRITMMIFTKRHSPAHLDAAYTYPILQRLLNVYMKAILVGTKNDAADGYIDPALLSADLVPSGINRALSRAVRPGLLWTVLIGNLMCHLLEDDASQSDKETYQTTCRNLLIEIVGPTAAYVDELPEEEFDFYHLWSLKNSLGLGPGGMRREEFRMNMRDLCRGENASVDFTVLEDAQLSELGSDHIREALKMILQGFW